MSHWYCRPRKYSSPLVARFRYCRPFLVALSIIGPILCIILAVALINGLLTWWGTYLNINEPQLTLQIIFGYVFYPVAFLMGVSRGGKDVLLVGRLIAEKVITVSA